MPTKPNKSVLIPDRDVAERYNVCVRTLERWDAAPELGFPPAIRINNRRYREVAALDAWDLRNSREAAELRSRSAPKSESAAA